MTENTGFRSGFAALVGRPNVGKSTLLNALLGEKVSIVSSHAQTTRNKITGVWNGDNAQVVFLDTPGMHKPHDFADIVPISAKTGDNLDELMNTIKKYLPEGPKYFPDDMVTDQPERNIAQEVVREKLLIRTRDEVPHAIGVYSEEFREEEDGRIYIRCTIYVERPTQKGIIIGKNGSLLKAAKKDATRELKKILGAPVDLDLWVKVSKDWKNKDYILRELGYKEHK